MNAKKHIIIGFIVFILLAITILFSMHSKKPSLKVSDLIENENINDLSLTIYYLSLSVITDIPLDVNNLINCAGTEKISVSGNELKEHIDLFKQISNDTLISVKKRSSYLNARLYYILESKKNGKLFDVAMWGNKDGIFVNELEVKENDIFYKVIIPFLPEDAAEEWKGFLVN